MVSSVAPPRCSLMTKYHILLSIRTMYVITLLALFLLDLLNAAVISHIQDDIKNTKSTIEVKLFES